MGTPWEAEVSEAEKYLEYAEDCLRIAKSMSGKDKETLLKIAKAWEERAEAAKKKTNG